MQTMKLLKGGYLVIFLAVWLIIPGFVPLQGEVKIIEIPGEVKIEGDGFKESLLANLSQYEIFEAGTLYYIDGSLLLTNPKKQEIVKLTSVGELLGRLQKSGQGPGEFQVINNIAPVKGNLAILDSNNLKMVYYTPGFKYIDEVKLQTPLFNFFIGAGGQYIFFGNPSKDIYFEIYSEDLQPQGKFGNTLISGTANDRMLYFDTVSCVAVVPGERGVWTAFRNRYDLRYYQQEKLAVEIKEKKGFFAGQEFTRGGKTFVMYKDKASYLAVASQKLYYFFVKDWKSYCDIFDLKNFRLLRRILFPTIYLSLAYGQENCFFALKFSGPENDQLNLVKVEF